MGYYSSGLILFFAVFCFSLLPEERAYSSGRRSLPLTSPTPRPGNIRENEYVRIKFGDSPRFCVGRSTDSVVYCADHSVLPNFCSREIPEYLFWIKKYLVLQGPRGKCLADVEGYFDEEANFDKEKVLRRLPLLHQKIEMCHPYLLNQSSWESYPEGYPEGEYSVSVPTQPITVTYGINSTPYVKFNLSLEPNMLCVGRNDSREIFCASYPRAGPLCQGANFVNFDTRYYNINKENNCYTRRVGFFDPVVEVRDEGQLNGLQTYDKSIITYDKSIITKCFRRGTITGRRTQLEETCISDGRRCRP